MYFGNQDLDDDDQPQNYAQDDRVFVDSVFAAGVSGYLDDFDHHDEERMIDKDEVVDDDCTGSLFMHEETEG